MVVRLLLLVHGVPDGVADALLHVLIRLEPDHGVQTKLAKIVRSFTITTPTRAPFLVSHSHPSLMIIVLASFNQEGPSP